MAIASTDLGDVEGEFPTLEEPPRLPPGFRTHGRRIVRILLEFSVGQGAIQLLGVLGGLLLVRRLSVESYAQYGLATAFQSAVAVLMDLGFASTIVPLVGGNREDLALVGRYVRAAKHLRDRAFLLIAPVSAAVFLAIMHKHHWSWSVQALLLASVLLALYSSGKVAYFSTPLLLWGRLRDYYLPQAVTGAAKLGSYVILGFAGGLNAGSAAGLSAIGVVANGALLERKSRPFLTWPVMDSKESEREVVQYVLPQVPATIFAAFQSQLTVLLIGLFGGTADLAQVSALGRIGQLFSVLMMFNVIVVEPFIARLNRDRLLRSFLGLFAVAGAACVPVTSLAFWYPEVFLWILGPKYGGLRSDIGWLIFGNCVSYLAGLLWIMNRARKWMFWSGSAVEIGLILAAQSAFLALVGVRTVRQAVLFTFACSFCYLIAHGYVSVYGFLKGDRPSAKRRAAAGMNA